MNHVFLPKILQVLTRSAVFGLPVARIHSVLGSIVVISLCLFCGCTRQKDGVAHIQYSFFGSVEQAKAEIEMVAQFEREHPDIKVEMLRFGTYYPEKLQA